MTRRKRNTSPESNIFVYNPNPDTSVSTATRFSLSSDNRRVRTRHERITSHIDTDTQGSVGEDADVGAHDNACPDLPPELDIEDIPPIFCDEVVGVQVVAKPKSKRYESSVSNVSNNRFKATNTMYIGRSVENFHEIPTRIRGRAPP